MSDKIVIVGKLCTETAVELTESTKVPEVRIMEGSSSESTIKENVPEL